MDSSRGGTWFTAGDGRKVQIYDGCVFVRPAGKAQKGVVVEKADGGLK
jgi:hypothetical protein